MVHAEAGRAIRNPHCGAPWIVIDHALPSVVVARWPGRLWRVEVTDPAPVQAQAAGAYTRAAAVRVIEELPASILFGPRGAEVVGVIEDARALTIAQAAMLSGGRHADAARAYGQIWKAWMAQGMPIPEAAEDLDGTLMAGSGGSRSPINAGLAVVHAEVFRRARALIGADAHTGGEEPVLVEPWQGASAALRDAALALGAPSIVNAADSAVLTHAWRTVIAR